MPRCPYFFCPHSPFHSLPFLFHIQSLQILKISGQPKEKDIHTKSQRERKREIREMKIQCDVCGKMEASVFCGADEAALCHGCDCSIHHANKLARQHERFSLLHPTSKDSPLCDICQEKRAYLFCKEDRAILCRECDLVIHRANEHTQKHNRFLLTGVKLSSSSLDPPSSSSNGIASTEHTNRVSTDCSRGRRSCCDSNTNRLRSVSNENLSSSNSIVNSDAMVSDTEAASTSSFSEYLIETIPGFCFEDLLDASFPPNGFCKEHLPTFHDQDLHVRMCLYPLLSSLPEAQAGSNGYEVGVEEIPKAKAFAKEIWNHNGRLDPEICDLSIKKLKRSQYNR